MKTLNSLTEREEGGGGGGGGGGVGGGGSWRGSAVQSKKGSEMLKQCQV